MTVASFLQQHLGRRLSLAVRVLALGLLLTIGEAGAANNFVAVHLPHGVRVELPRNWVALTNNQRITLDTAVQSRLEHLPGYDARSDLNFAANYFEDSGTVTALMNVRYYPDLEFTQKDAREAGANDVRELDLALQDAMQKSAAASGFRVLEWRGTRKETINGTVVFVTEYRRSPVKTGNFVVRLVRVFNAPRSFTLTVSYAESREYLLRPICDRVIRSLRVS